MASRQIAVVAAHNGHSLVVNALHVKLDFPLSYRYECTFLVHFSALSYL